MNITAPLAQGLETPVLTPKVVGDTLFFDREQCNAAGASRHDAYVGNDPFPHIVMDDFLSPDVLRRVVEEFPARKEGRFSDGQSKLKTGYQMEAIESPYITNLLNALNSSQFIEFLERMTGIKGLIADPHFAGGGLHETMTGGHLSIHVDFNVLPRLNLRRRMNLILFLNEDWNEKYGGNLELWDKDMTECRKSVAPTMGRAVLFNTDPGSYHGHPDPLTSPPDKLRRSIALYYYTAPEDGVLPAARTTQFKPRPGSKDEKPPVSLRLREIARDITPPIIMRQFRKREGR